MHIYPDNVYPEPVLIYNTHSFAPAGDDNDGLAEGGESIKMPVEIFNSGSAMATNVSAVLSTIDPAITITDMNESYPDIDADGHEWSNYNFDFDIAPGIHTVRTVEFMLDITSDEGIWTDTFVIDIYPDNEVMMPILIYNNHDFEPAGEDDDGLAEGGESIKMPVSLYNSGNIIATNPRALLSCTDPDITITDFSENFEDIAMGSEGWSKFNYDFDIASGITHVKIVEFSLDITSDEGSWTSTFLVEIYPDNEIPMPVLAYLNHEIDDTDSDISDGDGIPESGESVQLPVSLFNYGSGNASNVTALLYCEDPDITLVDVIERFGYIEAGSEDWSNYSYDFVISPNCPAKEVEFWLEITADEGTWTSYFTISISEPNSKDVTYPNPSNGTFKVLSTTLDGNYQYKLIDISGNELYNGEVFIADHHEPVMEFEGLVTGIYFLKLDNGTETRMQKIIIQ